MAGRKDPIKEVSILIAREGWSWDRVERAIKAVATPRARPEDPVAAVATYVGKHRSAREKQARSAEPPSGRLRVRAKVKRRRRG